jgi:heptosyltransferase-3
MSPSPAAGPAPRHILLACTQRIGDVLLATPLVRSLKRAWPAAEIDMLVFEGTEGVLAANPDIAQVITVAPRSGLAANFRLLQRLWRRYDLALTPLPTDRARLYCWAAGRRRLGFLQPRWQERSKALLLNQWQYFDDQATHSVSMGLRLAQLLDIAPCFEVVPPALAPRQLEGLLERLGKLVEAPFCVLHPCPKYRYKMWPQAAWSGLATWLVERGLHVAFTGSSDPAEMAYVNQIARGLSVGSVNLAGALSLAETAELIRRAQLYVGPDSAVTHIAAATGTPTIALFGPSNPVKWGPWPHDWKRFESPWQRRGSARQGKVLLLQGPGECVPCLLEGCDRHLDSHSDCLDALTLEQVTQAAEKMLSE